MTPEELGSALDRYFAQIPTDHLPGDKPWNQPEARQLLTALADGGRIPAGREPLAFRLVFDHLPWIEQELPHLAQPLERLVEEIAGAGPEPTFSPQREEETRRQALKVLPVPARPRRMMDGHLAWVSGLAIVGVALLAFYSTGTSVNGLIQRVAPSLSTVGDGSASVRAQRMLEVTPAVYEPGQGMTIRIRPPGPTSLYLFQVGPSGEIRTLLAERVPVPDGPRTLATTAGTATGEGRLMLWASTRTLPELAALNGKKGLGLLRQNVITAARAHGAVLMHEWFEYQVVTAPPSRH
jgi:hypothetical protein